MFRRKTKWAKLVAGLMALKAAPKKPIAGLAALLGGGYVAYRAWAKNAGSRRQMQAT